MPKPFSVQVSMSLSIADWRTELKKRLLKGSSCFVPRAIPNSSLSTSVSTVARWSVYNFSNYLLVSEESPDCFMLYGIKCFFDVHRCHPHVRLPLSASLGHEFVRHKVVRLFGVVSESCLAGTHWYRSTTARSRLYSIVERGVFKAVEDHRSTCSSLDLSRLLSCRSL